MFLEVRQGLERSGRSVGRTSSYFHRNPTSWCRVMTKKQKIEKIQVFDQFFLFFPPGYKSCDSFNSDSDSWSKIVHFANRTCLESQNLTITLNTGQSLHFSGCSKRFGAYFFLEFLEVLEGLESSGRMVGTISSYFCRNRAAW